MGEINVDTNTSIEIREVTMFKVILIEQDNIRELGVCDNEKRAEELVDVYLAMKNGDFTI